MNQSKELTTISTEDQVLTLINVFTVDPANQQKLIRQLQKDTAEVIRKLPGWVSSSLHASLDGKTVVNYAQWKTKEDWEAMVRNPEAKKRLDAMHQLVLSSSPHLYKVASVAHI